MIEIAKKNCAFKAVDNHLKDKQVVGIGSGSTIVYAVERIAELVKKNNWKIRCVSTSYQSLMLIKKHNLVLTNLDDNYILDICFDGADEIGKNLNLIKGGGGCLTQEKIVASAAKELIIIADYRKNSNNLGENWHKGIPIEIIPMAFTLVKNKIITRFGGKVDLRFGINKVGPVITDNSNFLLDWKFELKNENDCDWQKINTELKLIPGVVETGLFLNMTKKVYFGNADGSVHEKSI